MNIVLGKILNYTEGLNRRVVRCKIPSLTKEYECKVNYNNNQSIIELKEYIDTFEQTIKEKVPHYNMSLFYKNINKLKVEGMDEFQDKSSTTIAGYNSLDNILYLNDEKNIKDYIYHELFHVSSTINTGKQVAVGFDYIVNNKEYGLGLGELYTQLLTERYLESVETGYSQFFYLVKPLEVLIGQEKMENLFSNACLKGLIEEMKKYMPEEDISNYISSLDYLIVDVINGKILFDKQCQVTKDVNEILVNALTNKYQKDNNEEELEKGIQSLCGKFTINNDRHVLALKPKTLKKLKKYDYEL